MIRFLGRAPIVAGDVAAKTRLTGRRRWGARGVESLVTLRLLTVLVALGEAHAQERYSEELEILDDLSSTEVTEAADLDAASSIEPYPAEDRGLDPIVEETREVPPEVVGRLQRLKARIDVIADERAAKGGGLFAEAAELGPEAAATSVRVRPEAPPAMDSGVGNPDIVAPDPEIVDLTPQVLGELSLSGGASQ